MLKPVPAVIGREGGNTLDRSPVNHRACRDRHSDSHGQFRVTNYPDCVSLDSGRKPGDNPQRHGKNMQTGRRKAPSQVPNPSPSCCEQTIAIFIVLRLRAVCLMQCSSAQQSKEISGSISSRSHSVILQALLILHNHGEGFPRDHLPELNVYSKMCDPFLLVSTVLTVFYATASFWASW